VTSPGAKPVVTGLQVIVSKAGWMEAPYTFLDPTRSSTLLIGLSRGGHNSSQVPHCL
jgi:hypothetical protein